MKLKIAIPSKGRISDPAVAILEKAGLGLKDAGNRKLFSKTHNSDIDVMFSRAADIPEFVADGIVDMGITGLDLIYENNADVEILEDLKFGQTTLVLASPEDSNINSIEDVKSGVVVATEFPNLTDSYFKNKGIDAKIVELKGSTEIAPFIGVADIIADLTSTGTTLKMNHLKIIDSILDSSIKLIANKDAYANNEKSNDKEFDNEKFNNKESDNEKFSNKKSNNKNYNDKKSLIETVATSIKGVIDAERKKLVLMNVSRVNLEEVQS
ncbi:MAG: ATP phosphoribosyltransferase, partial [Methanobrevibacter sp.]|nr:ATP phosphoribosyltransferase [Methanobrevibacter sp.]